MEARNDKSSRDCLVVYELGQDTTEELLFEEFKKYGKVLSTRIITNKAEQQMGFANMDGIQAAAAAIAGLDQKPPYNWRIKLNEPMEVRKQRSLARREPDRAAAVLIPELAAKVEAYEKYEMEVFKLVKEFSSQVHVDGFREPRPVPGRPHFQKRMEVSAEVVFQPWLNQVEPLPCSVCRIPTQGHCHRCKARYCSRDCQIADWTVHAVVCREPELPSLVVAPGAGGDAGRRPLLADGGGRRGGDAPRGGALRGGDAHRGGTLRGGTRRADGYQSDVELMARGRARFRGGYNGRVGPAGDAPFSISPQKRISPLMSGAALSKGPDTSPSKGSGAAPSRRPDTSPSRGSGAALSSGPDTSPSRGSGAAPSRGPDTSPSKGAGAASSRGPDTSPSKGAGAASSRGPDTSPSRGSGGSPPREPRPVLDASSPGAVAGAENAPRGVTNGVRNLSKAESLLGSPPAAIKAQAVLESVKLQPGNEYEVAVSHADGAAAVYVRLRSGYDATCRLETKLQTAVTAGAAPPPVGALCAALFERLWYRGRVVSGAHGHYQVLFVDWGNTERVPADAVVPLPGQFCRWPAQAVRLCLPWQPEPTGWSEQQRTVAAALVQRAFRVRLSASDDGELTATLTDESGGDPLALEADAAATAAAAATSAAAPAPPRAAAAGAAAAGTSAAAPAPPQAAAAGAAAAATSAPAAAAPAPPQAAAAGATSPQAAGAAAAVAPLVHALPDGVSPLWTGEQLLAIPSTPLGTDGLVVIVPVEEFLECMLDLETLPNTAAERVRLGDLVVAQNDDAPGRALVCATSDSGHTLLFVDSGTVKTSVTQVRPLPDAWSLQRLSPVALCLRVDASAGAVSRDELLQHSDLQLQQRPSAAASAGQHAAEALLPDGRSVPVTVLPGRRLLDRLSDDPAAPAPEQATAPAPVEPPPAPGPTANAQQRLPVPAPASAVRRAQLPSSGQQPVLPTAMAHPQQVSGQLQQPDLLRAYLAMVGRLQTVCDTAAAPSAVTGGTLVAVRCAAVDTPAAWRRAEVLATRGDQARLRLLDWALIVTAQLNDIRLIDAAFAEVTALGVEFGLAKIARDACAEQEMPFYRLKLVNTQYNLQQTGVMNKVPQVMLFRVDDTDFCYNQKMLARIVGGSSRPGSARSDSASPVNPPTHPTLPPQQPAPAAPAAPRRPQEPVPAAPQPAPAAPQLAPAASAAKFSRDLPPLSLNPGDTVPVMVTEVLTAANVYGTPLTDAAVGMVAEVEAALAAAATAPPCHNPQPDQLLITTTDKLDGGWARVVLLEASADGAFVWLLDHGSMDQVPVSQLRVMPDSLTRIPAVAIDAVLQGFDQLSEVHAETAVAQLSSTEGSLLDVKIVRKEGDQFIVQPPEALVSQLRAAGAQL